MVPMVIGNILEPRMMGHRLGMSTMVVFLSLLIWGWLLGPVGMLLSVPLTSVCKIWMETTKGGSKLAILLGARQTEKSVTGMRRQVLRYALSFSIKRWPDMYRIVLGKVSTLSAAPLPLGLREQAPQGPRRERWLAGRALLSHTLSPLPEIIYGEQRQTCIRAGNAAMVQLKP